MCPQTILWTHAGNVFRSPAVVVLQDFRELLNIVIGFCHYITLSIIFYVLLLKEEAVSIRNGKVAGISNFALTRNIISTWNDTLNVFNA